MEVNNIARRNSSPAIRTNNKPPQEAQDSRTDSSDLSRSDTEIVRVIDADREHPSGDVVKATDTVTLVPDLSDTSPRHPPEITFPVYVPAQPPRKAGEPAAEKGIGRYIAPAVFGLGAAGSLASTVYHAVTDPEGSGTAISTAAMVSSAALTVLSCVGQALWDKEKARQSGELRNQ